MPWLADTARIERAWLDAYHEADAAPLTASDLASFPPERLADLVFAPHPATRLVRSRFAAVTIFAANRAGCGNARGRLGRQRQAETGPALLCDVFNSRLSGLQVFGCIVAISAVGDFVNARFISKRKNRGS